MHEVLSFHSTAHGASVQLSDGNCLAKRRADSATDAIVFGSRPLAANERVRIELLVTGCDDRWPAAAAGAVAGHLRLGLTDADPAPLTASDLPEFAYPDLVDREHFWIRPVDRYIGERTPRSVTVCLSPDGSLMFGPDREARVVLIKNLPPRPLWLLIDVYGRTTGVRIIQPDDVPQEILSLGQAAVRSYKSACDAGHQPVYRTRLVLFGRDVVGKNCLRSQLLSCKTGGKFGLSSSAIDLSASCSFSLGNQSRWKLATSSEEIFPLGAVSAPNDNCDESVDEDSETKRIALAMNTALLVLQRRRQKKQNASTKDTGNIQLSTDRIENLEESTPLLESESNSEESEIFKDLPANVTNLAKEILADVDRSSGRATAVPSYGSSRMPLQRFNSSMSQSEREVLYNAIDCSGDEAYFAPNQVYFSSRAIFIFVFDLRLDLNGKYAAANSENEDDNKDSGDEVSGSFLEYLGFWLHSIRVHASMASTNDSIPGSPESPPVFIVGTNRDCLPGDRTEQQKLVDGKFNQIREMIRGQPYEAHVVTPFHAISSDFDLDCEIEQIEALRNQIESMARSLFHMGEFIPSRWLNFELAVDKLVAAGTNFCSVGQLQEVALEEGIVAAEEFETLLQFYHELGLMMYVGTSGGTCLSNSVILKPPWLVDICRSILAADRFSESTKSPADEAALCQYTTNGILAEHLLPLLLGKSLSQKSVVINCMERLDLIVERTISNQSDSVERRKGRNFFVPFRYSFGHLPFRNLYHYRRQDVVFYYDFGGFLPDSLFYKILVHVYRWSQSFGGSEPRLVRGSGRFYLDCEHDFVLIKAPKHLSRIKVVIVRVLDLDVTDSDGSVDEDKTDSPPKPHMVAKVRNFLELTLCQLREKWMRRLSYCAYVKCWCDRACVDHQLIRCSEENCLHFLRLDECLSNKVVYCDHRRCKTSALRKCFPTSKPIANRLPTVTDRNNQIQGNHGNANVAKQTELPGWVKAAAKLLNGGSDGLDWINLAQKFGYKRNKIEAFNYDQNPGQALITDWIVSSGNTALSVDIMIKCLEQMQRHDVIEVIQKGQEGDFSPAQVFISYQWDVQDEVSVVRDVLERNGLSCWMDIGQMGGGDHLYAKVYEGIKNCKVTISCLTHKYLMSHYCNREMALADLLHKPIIPVLFESLGWPPVGPMSLIFSTLVYVNLKGVGGHGGSGIHADLDAKYQEIVTRVSNFAAPQRRQIVAVSTRSSSEDQSIDGEPASIALGGQQRPSSFHGPHSLQTNAQATTTANQTGQNNNNARGGGGFRTPAPNGTSRGVQQVHVAKCVMCTVL